MKSIYRMDQIQWNTLISDVAENFDDAVIDRGYELFRQGRAINLTMPAAQQIEAVVDDDIRHRLEINLDFFGVSRCSCGSLDNCEHMLAALLEYANLQQRSVQSLVHAKGAAVPRPAAKPLPQFAANRKAVEIAEKNNKSRNELQERTEHAASMSVSEWHELFQLCTTSMADRTRNLQYAHDALAAINKLNPELPPVRKQIYELHTYLFILGQLINHSPGSSTYPLYNKGSFIGFNTHNAIVDILEAIERIFIKELKLADEPECRPLVMETLAYLRDKMLNESDSDRFFWDPYDRLITNWLLPVFTGKSFFLEELQLLQSAEKKLGSRISRYSWLLAQSRMHFYLSRDREAWSCLAALNGGSDISDGDILYFYYHLQKGRQWQRLADWLAETAGLFESRGYSQLIKYTRYWDALIQQLPEAESRMLESLALLLPHSGRLYEEKLLAYNRWQQWMDYQLSTGSEPLQFRAPVFAPFEKHAPELLLPYYHQAVERAILLKNRDGYKTAVKLLKRLAKLYKKMKREPSWESFITQLAGRNSRLRALQEELRKGNLIG